MPRNPWTSSQLRFCREHYGTWSTSRIARAIGRTKCAVKCKVLKMGLRTRRFWTPAELKVLREHAKTMTSRQIAQLLGCSVHRVESARSKHGFLTGKKPPALPPAFEAFLRHFHAMGWSDSEIAEAWARTPVGRRINRRTVGDHRARLGLPNNALSAHRIDKIRRKTRAQLRAAGLDSLAALRRKVFRDRARAAGWPADLRPRAVQMLNALWDRGPMTRLEIANAIGMPWKGSRKSLVSNDPEGSYLAHLIRRGLVIVLKRAFKVHGQGKSCDVYSLPLDVKRKVSA